MLYLQKRKAVIDSICIFWHGTLAVGMCISYLWNGCCSGAGCEDQRLALSFVKLCDICGEMNPLVFCALEEVNLFFTLMVRSSVIVDVLPSVSKVAGVWRSLSWCHESVMLWRGIMGFIEIW